MSVTDKKCNDCDRIFKSNYLLNKHINRKTPCTTNLTCQKCNKVFLKIDLYNLHINRRKACTNLVVISAKKTELEIKLEIEKEKTNRQNNKNLKDIEKEKEKINGRINIQNNKNLKDIEKEKEKINGRINIQNSKNLKDIEKEKEKTNRQNNKNLKDIEKEKEKINGRINILNIKDISDTKNHDRRIEAIKVARAIELIKTERKMKTPQIINQNALDNKLNTEANKAAELKAKQKKALEYVESFIEGNVYPFDLEKLKDLYWIFIRNKSISRNQMFEDFESIEEHTKFIFKILLNNKNCPEGINIFYFTDLDNFYIIKTKDDKKYAECVSFDSNIAPTLGCLLASLYEDFAYNIYPNNDKKIVHSKLIKSYQIELDKLTPKYREGVQNINNNNNKLFLSTNRQIEPIKIETETDKLFVNANENLKTILLSVIQQPGIDISHQIQN